MANSETSGDRPKSPELPWESLQRQLRDFYLDAQSLAYVTAFQETGVKISGESYSVCVRENTRLIDDKEMEVKAAYLERRDDQIEEPAKHPKRIAMVVTVDQNPEVLSAYFGWIYGERNDGIVGWGISTESGLVKRVEQSVQANRFVNLGDEDQEKNAQCFNLRFEYANNKLTSCHLDVGYSLQTLRATFDYWKATFHYWPEQPQGLREPREFRGKILLKPTFNQLRQALLNIREGKPAIMMETATPEQVLRHS